MSSIIKPSPRRTARIRTFIVTLALASGAAVAQTRTGGAQPDGRTGPPAEALAACKTLKAGDACQFTDARGATSGSCWAPEGKPLACRPKNAPAPGTSAPNQAPTQ